MKKRNLIMLLILILIIVAVVSCFGKKGLAPGKYDVTQAVHEMKDDDYELQVKNYGEYDVKTLQVVKDPNLANMVLEIKPDNTHTLYVKAEEDIIIDNSTSSDVKLKKKEKR